MENFRFYKVEIRTFGKNNNKISPKIQFLMFMSD